MALQPLKGLAFCVDSCLPPFHRTNRRQEDIDKDYNFTMEQEARQSKKPRGDAYSGLSALALRLAHQLTGGVGVGENLVFSPLSIYAALALVAALSLGDIDLAMLTPCPTEPVAPEREENETEAAFATRQRDHAPIRMAYDLEKAKWDKSNRKCLMVIKTTIEEAIRGAIPSCATATEYMRRVERQFTSSSKAYGQYLIVKLSSAKYTGGGIREHILRLSNMARKLEPMDMKLPEPFIFHLTFASLPEEFSTFKVNYNSMPENWNMEKMIAMCVLEEERLKEARGDSLNYVKGKRKMPYNNKKNYHQGSTSYQPQPQPQPQSQPQ
ncbi:hypothetical protein ACP70R_035141 [Stipagrostis hirtigluma subsp. patula]